MSSSRSSKPLRALALAAATLAAAIGAPVHARAAEPAAGATAQPSGVVGLESSASADVPRDRMTIVFSTMREGSDAGAIQAQLTQALDAALAQARRVAKPGEVEVQTGRFALSPRYGSKVSSNGWQGSAELMVSGRDMTAISQLVGRITTMTVGSVGYDLSRALREKTENDLAAEAIARFRARAAEHARQFGYGGYALREVHVGSSDSSEPRPMRMRAMSLSSGGGEAALPTEAGRSTVTVTVEGTVQLTR